MQPSPKLINELTELLYFIHEEAIEFNITKNIRISLIKELEFILDQTLIHIYIDYYGEPIKTDNLVFYPENFITDFAAWEIYNQISRNINFNFEEFIYNLETAIEEKILKEL